MLFDGPLPGLEGSFATAARVLAAYDLLQPTDRGRSRWSRARRRQRDWEQCRSNDLEFSYAARDRPLVRRRTGVRLPRA